MAWGLLLMSFALLPAPTLVRVVFACVGLALHVRAILLRWLAQRPVGWIVVDEHGVLRCDGHGRTEVVKSSEPFGVTVLVNAMRTRALLAFTARSHTRYVPVHRDGTRSDEPVELSDCTATVAEQDVASGLLHGASLTMGDASRLLQTLKSKEPDAFSRIFLSDSKGDPVELNRSELRVGERTFNLTAPLEWRSFTFHESIGQVAALYQATWIRQGTAEVVLVAPMPAELTAWGATKSPSKTASLRDLRLMQSLPDAPPPRELRTAVERLFMLPLRQALDRSAPAMPDSVAPRRRREGRAPQKS